MTKKDREEALTLHKAHLVTLLANRLIVDKVLDNEMLQVRARGERGGGGGEEEKRGGEERERGGRWRGREKR